MYKQTNAIFKTKRIRLFALITNCTIIMKTNSRFSRNVYAISNRILCNKHDVTNTQPRKTMITMGKVDTSDLMMITTWAIDISSQSPILKWASWTHTTPYIIMRIILRYGMWTWWFFVLFSFTGSQHVIVAWDWDMLSTKMIIWLGLYFCQYVTLLTNTIATDSSTISLSIEHTIWMTKKEILAVRYMCTYIYIYMRSHQCLVAYAYTHTKK